MPDADEQQAVVLLTGASGYVGGRLIPLLERQSLALRCLARNPDKLRPRCQAATEIVLGDVLDMVSLDRAFQSVHTAYYLVHLMSGSKDFEKEDRQAAANFAEAAKKVNVKRIVYLGGLGDDNDPDLSPHLRSRHEVGKILRDSGIETIEFRASVVIGAGSLSFDLVCSLTNRLPVMICPRWLSTPTQPIAVHDVLAYLLPMPIRPGSLNLIELRLVSRSRSRVVQVWPVALTYWRGSSQIVQVAGGCWLSAYWVPQVVQMKWGMAGYSVKDLSISL